MDRRHFIAVLASGLVATTGCLSSSGTDIPAVTLQSEDHTSPEPDVQLSVTYNHDVATELPTEPTTVANDGRKWLLIRMDVTNDGGQSRDLTTFQYSLSDVPDALGPVQTSEPWELRGTTAPPGKTVTGWVVFDIPRDTTDATLTATDGQAAFSITFERDGSLTTDPQNDDSIQRKRHTGTG